MGDIGGRFTEGAKRLVAEATSCARELGHSYIGSEHFLLGLLRIGDCTAANLLYERGCEYAEMRSRVIGLVGMGARSSVTADDMTPSVRRILLRASLSVKSAGGNRVGNEHILLSLLREECTGARLIRARCGYSRACGAAFGHLPRLCGCTSAKKAGNAAAGCKLDRSDGKSAPR